MSIHGFHCRGHLGLSMQTRSCQQPRLFESGLHVDCKKNMMAREHVILFLPTRGTRGTTMAESSLNILNVEHRPPHERRTERTYFADMSSLDKDCFSKELLLLWPLLFRFSRLMSMLVNGYRQLWQVQLGLQMSTCKNIHGLQWKYKLEFPARCFRWEGRSVTYLVHIFWSILLILSSQVAKWGLWSWKDLHCQNQDLCLLTCPGLRYEGLKQVARDYWVRVC